MQATEQCDTSTQPLSTASLSPDLQVHKARIKGKKLVVTGDNFDEGAVILVNGEIVKTARDSDSPNTRLVAKKAGKMIPLDSIYEVAVRNSDGIEAFVTYFRGSLFDARVLQSHGPTYDPRHAESVEVFVTVGDYLLTTDPFDSPPFTVLIDPDYIESITNIALPGSYYRSYQAIQPGITRFYVVRHHDGDLPPQLLYDAVIRIE